MLYVVADLLAVQSVRGICCMWWPTYWQYSRWVNAVFSGRPTGPVGTRANRRYTKLAMSLICLINGKKQL